ncbi:class I SAM-dependent methyltransferase [Sphingomonas quercus]|uniref:50S ribosomal protein L11 methyltransferase n=1 Tax=Sphingomonas quercus TaxID=2842451 RepID=A0ABS6BEH0_9SPHN|nr:50S ribosomal protein L11 methyltransferase [Sphingomonas quercus]MBU3076708.1 50S ribosomal protein L11 methyltransferase [Sphingomonas quercus]
MSVPGVPEVRLHKAAPSSGLARLAAADEAFGSPYWAYYWGGGLALARHVLDRPEAVRGRAVLDLGAGSGLVGIAAMLAGARRVLAADTDPYAAAVLPLNAEANGVALGVHLGDLTGGDPPAGVDTVLVGDLFYEHRLAERVAAYLGRCVEAGMTVLVGDPGRAFLPRGRINQLSSHTVEERGEPAHSCVFAFTG